jgi:hypothetical protein
VRDQKERDAFDQALMAAAARTGAVAVELPGRSCGTCMMCCQVYSIRELNKPAGRWCVHAERGRGCGIYADRPDTCRVFVCMWLADATLGPEWKPDRAHFVVALDLLYNQALTITPAPNRPDAWKKEPYYSTIKGWARKFCPDNKKVLVIDQRGFVTAVLPDRDLPIGVVGASDEVVIYREAGAWGARVRPRPNAAAPAGAKA